MTWMKQQTAGGDGIVDYRRGGGGGGGDDGDAVGEGALLPGCAGQQLKHHWSHRSPGAEALPPHGRRYPKSPAQGQSSREQERGQAWVQEPPE